MERLDEILRREANSDPTRVFLRGSSVWSYQAADDEVTLLAARYRNEAKGFPVALRGANSPLWVIHLLSLLRAEIPVILLPPELSETDAEVVARLSDTYLEIREGLVWGGNPQTPSPPDWMECQVAVAFITSGSTGQPKIVLRSHASLSEEGMRYQRLWNASRDDVFMAVAPLCHAYTFGATLCAALQAGGSLGIAPFISPRKVEGQILELGGTILPLVPAMARSLAMIDQARPVQSNLRIAMVGTGPTTAELSSAFHRRWAVPLSRNYGSSETGAVLASLAPLDEKITGFPMPGLACELVETSGQEGQLWVRLEYPPLGYLSSKGFEPARLAPGGWWPMGDLFERVGDGLRLTLRLGTAIRRGGRQIQPSDVEAALLSHPFVSEAYVRGSLERSGEECIEAHIAPHAAGTETIVELRNYLGSRLAAFKIPNRWFFYDALPKTWSAKVGVCQLKTLESPAKSLLRDALQRFRLPSALFAAEQVGILQELDLAPQSSATLAATLACEPSAVSMFLDYLVCAGLVRNTDSGYVLAARLEPDWPVIVSLERHLQSTWLSPDEIASVLRRGVRNRRFEKEAAVDQFPILYLNAFCGQWQKLAARQIQRRLRLGKKSRVVEVGRAAGRITLELRELAGID